MKFGKKVSEACHGDMEGCEGDVGCQQNDCLGAFIISLLTCGGAVRGVIESFDSLSVRNHCLP